MRRVQCVWLPDWPLQRIRDTQPEHRNREIVLFADAGQRGLRVAGCCRSAAARGIVPGMPLAEAKGLTESVRDSQANGPVFLPLEPEADSAVLRKLAVHCQRFSPITGVEEPDSLLLDVTGCGRLFGGEQQLSEQLVRDLEQWGFVVKSAIADTVGAAWAVAHFKRDDIMTVAPGKQRDALGPLPIPALRIPATVVQTLAELDVRTISQLQRLPRDSLPSRIGSEVLLRLDQALGDVEELVKPVKPPEPISAAADFEHPIRDRFVLNKALRRLTTRVVEVAVQSQRGVQRLDVGVVDSKQGRTDFTVGVLRPSQSVNHLTTLVEAKFERITVGGEVVRAQVVATATALGEAHQFRLFDEGRCLESERTFAQLIDRLSNRLGRDNVVRPDFLPDAQPELSVSWRPALDARGQGEGDQRAFQARPRPLHLRTKPLPMDVVSVVPDGPPIRLLWNGDSLIVARYWGPERIETGWWRNRHVRRDYYRVETECGLHLWLFRRTSHGDWFLHGEFE